MEMVLLNSAPPPPPQLALHLTSRAFLGALGNSLKAPLFTLFISCLRDCRNIEEDGGGGDWEREGRGGEGRGGEG